MTALFPAYPKADADFHRAAIDVAMSRVVDSGRYILGDEVTAFEAEFAQALNVPHTVALGSGTDAVELMLRAHGIGVGDAVVLPSHAPSAVASAVRRCGAGILLADIEPETFTLCPTSLAMVLGSPAGQTVRAVLAIHLYGHPVDWAALQNVTDQYGVVLLEDGAQAHGAEWCGRKVGGLGRAAAFSFYPTKNLAALGDAGALTTCDADIASRVRSLRQYGWQRRYFSECDGVNSRMDELQAAVLRIKLRALEEGVAKRRVLADHYSRRLVGLTGIAPPVERSGCRHAYHQYVIRCPQQKELLAHLLSCGIPASVQYPAALHQQPCYQAHFPLPQSAAAASEVLSLPLHPYLTLGAVDRVCTALEDFANAGG